MQASILKSFRDIFSLSVLSFVIKVALMSMLISWATIWLIGDKLTNLISSYLAFIPWEWVSNSGVAVAKVMIVYMIFITINAILTSIMVEPLIIKLSKKHYPSLDIVGSADIKKSIWLSLKSSIIFFGLFLVTFPISFIPLVGAVWMLWLWSILIKSPTLYDITSLYQKDMDKELVSSKNSTIIAMIASGFNYIPILNILSPIFAQIIFLHYIANHK